MSAATQASSIPLTAPRADWPVLIATVLLALIGLVMVTSSSIHVADHRTGVPMYYFWRHLIFLVMGLAMGLVVYRLPLSFWQRSAALWYSLALLALVAVLVPGVGHKVNGALRWIALPGGFNVQPSDWARLASLIFLASFLARAPGRVREGWKGFLVPLALALVPAALMLMEPDFGAAAVLVATTLGVLFLTGAPLTRFAVLLGLALAAAAAAIALEPYRLERVTSFLDPWEDPYRSGFQLIQALIAFGRGELFGVGLGASVQKMFYLPEAHTDFVLAVLGEELGLIGVLTVLALFSVLAIRGLAIARQAWDAGLAFPALLAYALALTFALQVLISVGVNLGALPTKGLTMPFLSYGGNALLVACVLVALLLRVRVETRAAVLPGTAKRGGAA